MSFIFNEDYDRALDSLAQGATACLVPTSTGLFKAVFAPSSEKSRARACAEPERFAVMVCVKTRDYARMNGYEVI